MKSDAMVLAMLPLVKGREEAWRRFLQELGDPAPTTARRRAGIENERVWVARAGEAEVMGWWSSTA